MTNWRILVSNIDIPKLKSCIPSKQGKFICIQAGINEHTLSNLFNNWTNYLNITTFENLISAINSYSNLESGYKINRINKVKVSDFVKKI